MKSILLFVFLLYYLFLNKFWEKISKTILISKIDTISDSIIWLDLVKEYRQSFPNHKLVLCYKKM